MQTISKENATPKSKKTASESPVVTTGLGEKQQYNDIYVRANFNDRGVYPRDGTLCQSPDIIPYGEDPVSDPYVQFIQNNWDKDLGKNVQAREANYIYMRGKNLSTQPRNGKLYLYYSKASLILWPQDPKNSEQGWKHQNILTSTGEQFSSVQAAGGAYVVTGDPFYWVPENIDPNDHYCLIGRVETIEHPNPIPDHLKDINDFAEYISTHPNMCWRNVYTINANHETNTATVRYDQGEKEEKIYIFIECTGAPVGSEVSFVAGKPGPEPMIKLAKTRVTNEDTFIAGGYFTIPADWSSNISYTYYSNGFSPSTPPMTIELKAMLIVDENHKLYGYATPLEELGATTEQLVQLHREKGLDPSTFNLRGIKIGSYLMQAPKLPDRKSDQATKTSKTENDPTDSFMKSISFGWVEEHRSIFGNSYTENQIRTEKNILKPYHPEKLYFSSSDGDSSEASLHNLVEFYNGDNAGKYYIHLITTNIPVGCEIAFTGGSEEYPIVLNKTKVSNFPGFSAGVAIELPADLSTNIRFSLWKNGYELPKNAEASIELKAVLQTDPVNLAFKPPIHGKIIGSVTAFIQ